jgi:mono/diheme cytochrome c family protein
MVRGSPIRVGNVTGVTIVGSAHITASSQKAARESMMAKFGCFGAIWLFALTGCGPRELAPVQRGEVVYRKNCISCHGANPSLSGPLGPSISGSSRALLEARILAQSYPPGYRPKRRTHQMRSLPWLSGSIGDLKAYLDASTGDQK